MDVDGPEDVQQKVGTWIVSQRNEELESIVNAISDGAISITNLVHALGEYLTSEDDKLREQGVQLLASVISKCTPQTINRQTSKVLCTFFSSKLEDTETVAPALKGLSALVALPSLAQQDAESIIVNIIEHVNMKAYVQSVRYMVFLIIDTLLFNNREVLKRMGDKFLQGYIELADGEKDPRNLILSFCIVRVLLIEFDVEKHIEGFFNITFCYFPISFKPPANDPYLISSDDLRRTLRLCLAATPSFALLGYPLFTEKLSSGSLSTKIDCLETLIDCIPIYGCAATSQFTEQLWSALRLEILQPIDEKTQSLALSVLITLVNVVESPDSKKSPSSLAKSTCVECVRLLNEPDTSQAPHAAKVAAALIVSTPAVSSHTIKEVFHCLILRFKEAQEPAERRAVLSHLPTLVQSLSKAPAGVTLPDTIKEEIIAVVAAGLQSASCSDAALHCVEAIFGARFVWSEDESAYLVYCINETLTSRDGHLHADISSQEHILKTLQVVSTHAPAQISGSTLPLLFGVLPDSPPSRDMQSTPDTQQAWSRFHRTLDALALLCNEPQLFDTMVVRLWAKIDLYATASHDGELEVQAAYIHSLITTVVRVLEAKEQASHTDIVAFVDRLLPRVFTLFIAEALKSSDASSPLLDYRVVESTSRIISIVVRSLSAERQQKMINLLLEAFVNGRGELVSSTPTSSVTFGPLSSSAPLTQQRVLPLFAAAIVPLYLEVQLAMNDLSSFMERLIEKTIDPSDETGSFDALSNILASIVNKHTSELSPFLDESLPTYFDSNVSLSSSPITHRTRALQVWSLITKSLVVRNDKHASMFTDRLFGLLSDPDLGYRAALSFGSICSHDNFFTKANHCVSRPIFSQKYFNIVLPRLVEGAKSASDGATRNAYLIAVAQLLKSVPSSVYVHQISSLMALMIRGLSLDDSDVKADIIETLLTATKSEDKESSDSPVITSTSEHASSLIENMQRNLTSDERSSARVKIAALSYLGVLAAKLRYDVIHPHKNAIVRALERSLDDPRRAVRKEAVQARTLWITASG